MLIQFNGEAIIRLSQKPPVEFIDNIDDIVKKLNSDVLKKGATNEQEAAKITKYEVSENQLIFYIAAGQKVGAHIAALRIKNYLSQILGEKYKIGIRDVILKNGYIQIDGKHDVKIDVPLIKKIKIVDANTIIHLHDLSEGDLQKPLLKRLLSLIEEKEKRKLWGGKIEHWVKIKESSRKTLFFEDDPNIVLENIGWIKNIAPGQWLYTPPLTYILRKFEAMFIDIVLEPLGFQEAIFPKMEPLEIGLKTGHLKGTPNQMIFASLPISYNIEEFEEWQDYVSIYGEANSKKLQKFIEPPTYYLCFAQCPPFYRFLSKLIFTDKRLPVKWFDKSGPSFRWEGTGGLRGLERLVEFHRIEVVWLGTKEQVIEIRNKLLERYEYFMDKVLDLEWRWAWVTPWFLVHAGETKEFAEKIDIDQPGTIDFEAYLPYRGQRNEQKNWLEIGNISIHGAKYTKTFRIRHASDKILWTGCSGFGAERWVLAFLGQKGFNRNNWPSIIRDYIKNVPLGLETSNYPKPQYKSIKNNIESSVRK